MKLKKQFQDFYKLIKIDMDQEAADLTEKRKVLQTDIENKLPGIMSDKNIELKKSDIEIFDQGSYKLNTTIAITPYDRDVAVLFPLDVDVYTDTRKIKGYVRDSLKHENRTLDIKEPCVNVSYVEQGEERMHIDLPVYAAHGDKVYLARGSEFATEGNFGWEEADPKGLNEWLLNYITGNDQLRRIIRYIKKWKYEKYKGTSETEKNKIPPSIGLTILACKHFVACVNDEGDNDLQSLYDTMNNILACFDLTYEYNGDLVKAEITEDLPVVLYTDVFNKIKKSDKYGVTFYNRFNEAVNNLADAINESSEHDAGVSVQKVFGDEFIVPPKETTTSSSSVSSRREHGFG